MPRILNIETATPVCSVALSDGDKILSSREIKEGNSHSSHLSVFIEECLKEAGMEPQELDAVAVSSGPGSYTGLRIGYSTAKGLCYALDKPLIVVDTLASLADTVRKIGNYKTCDLICPMIDARRMEVYMAVFDMELKKILTHQAFIVEKNSFGKFFDNKINMVFCGNGSLKIPTVIANDRVIINKTECSALNMVALSKEAFDKGSFDNLAYTSPFYIKSPFITKPKKRL